jgi:small subunit ribosomal protein S13
MVYIFDTKLNPKKKVVIALCSIYGIGYSRSNFICKKLGFNSFIKINQLISDEITILINFITITFTIGVDLRKNIRSNILQAITINSYRGTRHRNKLPVRGQRTHTNSKILNKNSLKT